jgi:GT2 family glycosyltransferase
MILAAFIMTFERETILVDTISKLFSQTLPPEKILIVDNGSTSKTEKIINAMDNPKIEYYRVGFNAGPAGAALIGLRRLAEEGYKWIYWGDDDDPPLFLDTLQLLIELACSQNNCGCVGAVGHFFNKNTGTVQRVSNELLYKNQHLSVDTIGGGMQKIISGPMILNNNVLPTSKLFYGCEELDFDLKIKRAGFCLYVACELYLRYRTHSNRLNYKRKSFGTQIPFNRLKNKYYSTRNLLCTLYGHRLYRAFFYTLMKSIFKTVIDYRYGIKYGMKNSKFVLLAILDFFCGRYGQRNFR